MSSKAKIADLKTLLLLLLQALSEITTPKTGEIFDQKRTFVQLWRDVVRPSSIVSCKQVDGNTRGQGENPKYESKQARTAKVQMLEPLIHLRFEFWCLGFASDFGISASYLFRVSSFVLRIYISGG